MCAELGTLECYILNPDRKIDLEIITRGGQAPYNLEAKKKRRSSIIPDIHQSKFPAQIS